MLHLIALLALPTSAPAPSLLEPLPLPALILPAAAEEADKPVFSYSFVEANYLWTDVDGIDNSLDGWELRLSLEIFLGFFLQGSYSEISSSADLNQYRFGAGWHLPLGEKLDLYGILSVTGADIEEGNFDDSEDGIAAEVGARFLLTDKFEINGQAEWVDLDGSEVGFGAGGRFYFTPKLSAGLNVDFIDSSESFAAGLRFQF